MINTTSTLMVTKLTKDGMQKRTIGVRFVVKYVCMYVVVW